MEITQAMYGTTVKAAIGTGYIVGLNAEATSALVCFAKSDYTGPGADTMVGPCAHVFIPLDDLTVTDQALSTVGSRIKTRVRRK